MKQILKTPHFSALSLCSILFLWDIVTKGILSLFFFYLQSLCIFVIPQKQGTSRCMMMRQDDNANGVRLSREEVVMVMGELGLRVESDGEGLEGVIGEEEVEELLMVSEAETEAAEMKSVFEVFDENGDGFIEGRELQRVFKCLGMEKDVGECEKMISVFDENGDGMIDHNEFVKFMEQSIDDADTMF